MCARPDRCNHESLDRRGLDSVEDCPGHVEKGAPKRRSIVMLGTTFEKLSGNVC